MAGVPSRTRRLNKNLCVWRGIENVPEQPFRITDQFVGSSRLPVESVKRDID